TAARVRGDEFVVGQLIEVKSGLLRMAQVDRQLQVGDSDLDFVRQFAPKNTGLKLHSFRSPNDCVVALEDGAYRLWERRIACLTRQICQRPNDQILPLIHRQSQRLQNQMIPIAIDNHPWQTVTLAPDQPAKSRIHVPPGAILDRLTDPAFEKIEIE